MAMWWADENPVRYAGEYYDTESGLIYLRARYYDSSMGRFITEDQHWNVDNMIYGKTTEPTLNGRIRVLSQNKSHQYATDVEQTLMTNKQSEDRRRQQLENIIHKQKKQENKPGSIKTPSIETIKQSQNLYAYAMNNPIYYADPSGNISVKANWWGITVTFTHEERKKLTDLQTLGTGVAGYLAGKGVPYADVIAGALGVVTGVIANRDDGYGVHMNILWNGQNVGIYPNEQPTYSC